MYSSVQKQSMAKVTLSQVYAKLSEVQGEVRALSARLVPEVEISAKESRELDRISAEMRAGKETNWRNVFKK